jgi:hypothetical protein
MGHGGVIFSTLSLREKGRAPTSLTKFTVLGSQIELAAEDGGTVDI